MRFVLFYLNLLTMYVMGYRQRQLRNGKYGKNLIVTANSIQFFYSAEETKNRKPLEFEGSLPSVEGTHGLIIRAHSTFYKRAYPYIQQRLAPWTTGNEEKDREMDPRGHVFVCMNTGGRFCRFPSDGNTHFAAIFKNACRRFIKHPELRKEAILLAHPQFFRGASMDKYILDDNGTIISAGKYYGIHPRTIERSYKDKKAASDASKDVVLMNAEMAKIGELKQGRRRRSSYLNRRGRLGHEV
jgi:hypothetical protein